MATRKPTIVNPGKVFTPEEEAFIHDKTPEPPAAQPVAEPAAQKPKRRARPRNFSMFDDFYEDMVQFLAEFPNEGNKSSFIVRVVGEYMEKKRLERRRNQLPPDSPTVR